MNKRTVSTLAMSGLLVATNLYWRRREQAVREGMAASEEWEESEGVHREEIRAAEAAAKALDTRPADLPEKARVLNRRVRDLESELDDLRRRWVETWWAARTEAAVDPTEPHVLSVRLDDGTLSDAETFGERTAENDREIAIVTAHADSTFVVTVGDALTDEFSAATLAQDLTDRAGGGAGGSDQYATGGGVDDLASGSERLRERLEDELG